MVESSVNVVSLASVTWNLMAFGRKISQMIRAAMPATIAKVMRMLKMTLKMQQPQQPRQSPKQLKQPQPPRLPWLWEVFVGGGIDGP